MPLSTSLLASSVLVLSQPFRERFFEGILIMTFWDFLRTSATAGHPRVSALNIRFGEGVLARSLARCGTKTPPI